MGSAAFNFGPQESTLKAQAAPASTGGGDQFGPLFAAILAERRRKEAAAQQAAYQAAAPALLAAPSYGKASRSSAPIRQSLPSAQSSAEPYVSPMELQLKQAQTRAAIMALQEQERPAPKRLVTGRPGIEGGWTLDPMSMNARQRQMFLPDAAGIASLPTQVGMAADPRRYEEMDRQRQAAPAFGPSGGIPPTVRGPSMNAFYGR